MSVILSVSIAGVALLLYTLAMYLQKKDKTGVDSSKSALKVLPGPKSWPMIGSALTLAKYSQPWEGFSALRKIYGDIYGLNIGTQHCVVVSSIEAIKEVLVYKAADFANRPNFARFAAIFRGRRDLSVALCDWSEKQRKRRDVTFPFTHPRNASFGMGHLESCIQITLKDIVNQIQSLNGNEHGSHDVLLFTSANLFYHFLCNKRFDYKNSDFRKTIRNYHVIFCDLFRGYSLDFFPWIRFFNDHILTQLHNWSQQVSNFTEPILEEHEATLDKDNPKDLVDVLLLNKPVLSRYDSMVIIEDLVGGHSALHNMWMWLVALVGLHKNVAERIKEEVEKADPNNEGIEMKHKSQLCYTDATINEVLRVVASPIIPHRSTKETCVQGYDIPKDSLIFFNTCDLNMDETLWPEPAKFRPERFLRENDTKVFKPDYFVPFGTGKRSCLGDCIVRCTLLLGLATLVRHFQIDVVKGHHLLNLRSLPGTVLFPEHDIKVRFTPRKISS